MSLYYFDANGYVGEAASVSGWASFQQVLERSGGVLERFSVEGSTRDLEGLQNGLKRILARSEGISEDDVSVAEHMLRAASRADILLILSDGVGDEPPPIVGFFAGYKPEQLRDRRGRWTLTSIQYRILDAASMNDWLAAPSMAMTKWLARKGYVEWDRKNHFIKITKKGRIATEEYRRRKGYAGYVGIKMETTYGTAPSKGGEHPIYLRPLAAAFAEKRPLYVKRNVMNSDQIIAWAKAQGFETTLPPEKMHVTVAFSRKPVDWSLIPPADENELHVFKKDEPIMPSYGREVAPLGDKGAVVLKFRNWALERRWHKLRECGYSRDYGEDYYPHVTVSYNKPDNLKDMAPYTGVIELGPEIFEEIRENANKETAELSELGEYAQVKRDLDSLEAKAQAQFLEVLREMRKATTKKISNASNLAGLVQEFKKLPYIGEFRNALNEMLRSAWRMGNRDGGDGVIHKRAQVYSEYPAVGEFAKIKSDSFTPRSALKWLKEKEIFVTGVFSDGLLNKIKNVLVNAIKLDSPLNETTARIFDLFEPFLGNEDVLEGGVGPEAHALQTMIRTVTTEAYNHGRLTEYLDPNVAEYMQGARYSAILDDKTTEVCRYLDGRIFKLSDPALPALTPPNHFNCRSILVPVVIGEKVDADDFITPVQKGRAEQLADKKFLSEAVTSVVVVPKEDSAPPPPNVEQIVVTAAKQVAQQVTDAISKLVVPSASPSKSSEMIVEKMTDGKYKITRTEKGKDKNGT